MLLSFKYPLFSISGLFMFVFAAVILGFFVGLLDLLVRCLL